MPTTVGGLVIFAAFLTPGFLNYVQRRRRVPQRTLSPLVEVATFVSTSFATNLVAIGVFIGIRKLFPSHTPNIEYIVKSGSSYVDPNLGYIFLWSIIVL